MSVLLAVNDKREVMLLHDQELRFAPAWVEFSRDGRGVRVISVDGKEFKAGIVMEDDLKHHLRDANKVFLVWMKDGKVCDSFEVPFIPQQYEVEKVKEISHGRSGSTQHWY